MEYSKAPEYVVEMVHEVAEQCHARLDGTSIAVLFQDQATKCHGRAAIATASLPPKRMAPLLDGKYDFVICIAEPEWDELDEGQRKAVIDHELCHCALDPTSGKPFIRPHDYEEFAEVVARHGMWRKDTAETRIQESLLRAGIKVGTMQFQRVAGE